MVADLKSNSQQQQRLVCEADASKQQQGDAKKHHQVADKGKAKAALSRICVRRSIKLLTKSTYHQLCSRSKYSIENCNGPSRFRHTHSHPAQPRLQSAKALHPVLEQQQQQRVIGKSSSINMAAKPSNNSDLIYFSPAPCTPAATLKLKQQQQQHSSANVAANSKPTVASRANNLIARFSPFRTPQPQRVTTIANPQLAKTAAKANAVVAAQNNKSGPMSARFTPQQRMQPTSDPVVQRLYAPKYPAPNIGTRFHTPSASATQRADLHQKLARTVGAAPSQRGVLKAHPQHRTPAATTASTALRRSILALRRSNIMARLSPKSQQRATPVTRVMFKRELMTSATGSNSKIPVLQQQQQPLQQRVANHAKTEYVDRTKNRLAQQSGSMSIRQKLHARRSLRLSSLNEDSCILMTPKLMRQLLFEAAKSGNSSSAEQENVEPNDSDASPIEVKTIKPTTLLKYLLKENHEANQVHVVNTVEVSSVNFPLKEQVVTGNQEENEWVMVEASDVPPASEAEPQANGTSSELNSTEATKVDTKEKHSQDLAPLISTSEQDETKKEPEVLQNKEDQQQQMETEDTSKTSQTHQTSTENLLQQPETSEAPKSIDTPLEAQIEAPKEIETSQNIQQTQQIEIQDAPEKITEPHDENEQTKSHEQSQQIDIQVTPKAAETPQVEANEIEMTISPQAAEEPQQDEPYNEVHAVPAQYTAAATEAVGEPISDVTATNNSGNEQIVLPACNMPSETLSTEAVKDVVEIISKEEVLTEEIQQVAPLIATMPEPVTASDPQQEPSSEATANKASVPAPQSSVDEQTATTSAAPPEEVKENQPSNAATEAPKAVEQPIVTETNNHTQSQEAETKNESSKADEQKSDEPIVSDTISKEPNTSNNTAKEPEAQDNKVEEPKVQETIVEESQNQETIVEAPKAPETIAEEPKVSETKIEESKIPENKVEEPKAPSATVEEPISSEAIHEKPKVEESKPIETMADEVAVETKPSAPESIEAPIVSDETMVEACNATTCTEPEPETIAEAKPTRGGAGSRGKKTTAKKTNEDVEETEKPTKKKELEDADEELPSAKRTARATRTPATPAAAPAASVAKPKAPAKGRGRQAANKNVEQEADSEVSSVAAEEAPAKPSAAEETTVNHQEQAEEKPKAKRGRKKVEAVATPADEPSEERMLTRAQRAKLNNK